jgi:serine/threonine protein kinase/tetratricopeptide (TPR) repeat protein
MSQEFQRDYLIRLPSPLAQLYQRAYNDKSAQSRHNNTFYLFEALVKLAAAPAVAAYLHDVEHGGGRVAELDRLLVQLALPSLGQWVGMLRALAKHFGTRPDAAAHPLGHLWDQLNRPYRDRPGLLALYRRIKNGLDGEPAGDQSCSAMQMIDALVPYRNAVFGHGAGRFESFYEKEMGPLLFPAANEMLAEGMLDVLGPRGSRLVHIAELRMLDEVRVEVGLRELVGERSARTAPVTLTRTQADALVPDRVAVLWPGRPVPLRLDPLLLYREREMGDEVLFLNRDRNGRQVEFLSYTRGEPERDRATAPALAALLARVTGRAVAPEQLDALAQQSMAETPSVEALFGPAPGAVRALGDYEVLAEIGRGGMGVVYLARQLSLGRLVALKMLPADLAGGEVALARFRREMRLLARCDHPNIVKVLASGTLPDGRLYYTMEYVPGCDLEQVWREISGSEVQGDASTLGGSTWTRAVLSASLKKRQQMTPRPAATSNDGPVEEPLPPLPLPPLPELPSAEDDPGGYAQRVAMLVRDAALALQAIHDQQVVHRDVKPANVMLTPDGSRVVLMDFGLAKGQSLSLSASRAGGLLGTLRYAAPEQLAAASLKVGPAADVRGLGVTLWELLTRRRLFHEAEDERQLAALVHDEDVPLLRTIDPGLDRDLEAIVARSTERRVADRIATAGQLAEYLQLYLEGKPLPIRPPTTAELVGRWVRGHKGLVGSLATAALVILVTVISAFVLITQSRDVALVARNDAKAKARLAIEQKNRADSLNRAEDVRLTKLRVAVKDLILDGQGAIAGKDWEKARSLLDAARAKMGNEPKLQDLDVIAGRLDEEARRALAQRAARNATALQFQEFGRYRDLALFHGTLLDGIDMPAQRDQTRDLARKALGLLEVTAESGGALQLPDTYTETERRELVAGCYELLLVLADVEARAGHGHEGVDLALKIVNRSASLGFADHPTRAYHLRRAGYLARRGDVSGARLARIAAAEVAPRTASDFFLVGDERYKRNDLTAALEAFEGALRVAPDHFWSRYFSAVCMLNLNRPAEARVGLTACLAWRPGFAWIYLLRGYALGRLGEFALAEADFGKAEELAPGEYALYVNRGAVRVLQTRYDAAVADFTKAIAQRPKEYQAYANLARALDCQGKSREAIEALDQAIRLAPSAILHLRRARLRLTVGDGNAARSDFDRARELEPVDSPIAHRARAEEALAAGRFPEATREFNRYLDARGVADADFYQARGLARANLGDDPGAVEDYTRALALEPNASNMRTRRGWTYLLSSQKLAENEFREAIRLNPENADAHSGLGYTRVLAGRYEEAIGDAEKAVALGPRAPELLYNAGCILAKAVELAGADARYADRSERASRHAERALDLIREALERLPPPRRTSFWEETVANDPALKAIRASAGFAELDARYTDQRRRDSP